MKLLRNLVLLLLAIGLGGCGYNAMQRQDEAVKNAWSEVLNQYQRRADLVPNLVATVKGYAQHEEKVFTEVADARARVGSIQVTPELANDPQALAKFQSAQGQLGNALSRLMVVSENYPTLKADGLFQNLQAQLEGTENRITVARQRYIESVQQYNTLIRTFPNNLTAKMFGYTVKPNFSVQNEQAISTAPTVDFGGPAPANAASAH
ncbi:LemA family protein [Rhodanobacter sp. DHB23]|uniref:LemA family protein n=1 Tax=Rhodanobacter sp. DHB23 TaxID=2775923 RepID=UPI001785BE9C|nr:LemA family protein [Rhodanobacter sp. DHB23]MBD8871217.1 LemA family protein [Rhodanobacter sp. DHB23]